MSTVIWKYRLPITDEVSLDLPADAVLLTVQSQRQDLCLWAIVDPDAPRETRRFRIVGTGNPTPDSIGDYIGTAQTHLGALVWHVFEAGLGASRETG